MSKYKANVGQRILIVNGDEKFKNNYKNGDVMTVTKHGALYLIAVDKNDNEYALSESEYEVIKEEKVRPLVDFQSGELEITQEQMDLLKEWFESEGKEGLLYAFRATLFGNWADNKRQTLNELSIEKMIAAVFFPDKVKIKSEVKYEKTNPVTALEWFRDGMEIYYKKKGSDKWGLLNGGVHLQRLIGDEYEFSVKVNG